MSMRKLFCSFAILILVTLGGLTFITADDKSPLQDATNVGGAIDGEDDSQSSQSAQPPAANSEPQTAPKPVAPKAVAPKPVAPKPVAPTIAEILRIRKQQGSVLSGSILDDGGEGPSFVDALRRASDDPNSSVGSPPSEAQLPSSQQPPSSQRLPSSQQPPFSPQPPFRPQPSRRPAAQAARPQLNVPYTLAPQSIPNANPPASPFQPEYPQTADAPIPTPPSAPWQQSPTVPSFAPYANPPSPSYGIELVHSLRNSARLLEEHARKLESTGQSDEADKIYILAHRIRKRVRQIQSKPKPPISNARRYAPNQSARAPFPRTTY
jgi:hypothetical protein